MQTITNYEGWIGRDAYDSEGNKIGEIDQIYYDDVSGRPEWIAIRTGFFGMNTSFAPIAGAKIYPGAEGENLQIPYTKDAVKGAPNISPDYEGLPTAEEQRLFDHYGFAYDARRYGVDEDERIDRDYSMHSDYVWRDVADVPSSEATEVTRSEEHLRVGTETVPTGKARLRKYVVTEQQNVTVPVSHEEVRVEHEPISGTGEITGDEEAEVTTYAERPVVGKETVAKEKVKLSKDTVADQETVGGEVRKEQVEVETDDKIRSSDKPRY